MRRPRTLLRTLSEDLRTVVERDPSVRTRAEAVLHPALPAVWTLASPTGCTGEGTG
ncbi:hypothetical protein ABZ362_32550 [Streptomyces sp. NPDC005951]|uniref:hypothetical protein n=1 Tax=Streptomyces sp. NPDC005951 TaxID=3154573 RepID=UPI0033E2D145